MKARMLNKAHTKNGLAGPARAQRRCICGECSFTKTGGSARQTERRAWQRELRESS